MEKKFGNRKSLRRKYKRYAAAIIGTAILTGTALPGIPIFSKAFAGEKPPSPPIQKEQLAPLAKDGWHEHKYDWPSSGDNQAWYEDGHIYYRNDRNTYRDHHHYGYFQDFTNPVTVVKTYAAQLNFDPDRDSFTLIHQGRHKATVGVINNATGQRFKIDLERDHDGWKIVVLRGIGDQNFPATFHSIARR